jgi:hypothetical protein
VRAAQVLQLDAVLQGAQELVRRVQRLAVLASDVPARGEGVERRQGARGPEVLVGATVHQLQELDGELDVPQPARAELELAVRLARRDRVQHPASHRLDIADEAVALGDLPDHRLDQRQELAPESQVAGDRPGLEQGLELPGLGPALVVDAVAGEGPDQRPGLAFRAEVGVDRPDRALAGVLRAHLHESGRELGGDLGGHRLVDPVGRLEDVEHVDVGDVVQLVPPALAEGDHRKAGAAGIRDPGPGGRERGLQRAGSEVRQLGRRVVHAEVVGQVARGQAGEQPPVLDAQGVDRLGSRQRRRGLVVRGVGADGLQQRRSYGVRGGAGGAQERVGELSPLVGVPTEMVGQRLARAEHRQQTHRAALVVGELGDQSRLGAFGQADQTRQGLVRVGGAGQQRHQRIGRFPEPGELVGGAGGVAESQPQQPGARGVAAGAHRVNLRPRGLRRVLDLVQAIRKLSCSMW